MPHSDSKIVILVRHAHRDNSVREADNGLSALGKRQALSLRDILAAKYPQLSPTHAVEEGGLQFFSSPKKRCLETLDPLAKLLGLKVVPSKQLIECSSDESEAAFRKRIGTFWTDWKNSDAAFTVICSHGDWLPLAAESVMGKELDFPKCGWAEAKLADGRIAIGHVNCISSD